MMAEARILGRLLVAQARGQAQYRLSFTTDLVGTLVFSVVDLFCFVVMFRVTRTFGGFRFDAGLLMATLAGLGFAMADLMVGNIERLRDYVRTGALDTVLIRPVSALGQLLIADFGPRKIGRVVVMAVGLAVAAVRASVPFTPTKLTLLVMAPLAGAVLFGAVFVGAAVIAFWWIDSGECTSALTYGGRDFAAYPLTVYDGVFRTVLGFGVGYAFAGYYPALTLLDLPDPLGMPGWAGWCGPPVAAVAVCAAGMLWRLGIIHYRSTGS